MDFDISQVRIKPGEPVDLKRHPTRLDSLYANGKDYKALLNANVKRMSDLQERFFAASRRALLVVFQAMDTAGKDGCIEHVLSGVNPQGCMVHSFRHPSPTELEHDFLWRTTQVLPERGMIGVFNRSYYEEVLVVRVHPEILAAQHVPADGHYADSSTNGSIWKQRFESINEHEAHLHRNGTRILKFFLHISKDEQRRRLLRRIDDPDKRWKFSPADIVERELWDEYMHAYAKCLEATSTDEAPWYCIPADDKENARLIVSQVILKTLESLQPEFPSVSEDRVRELYEARARLEKGKAPAKKSKAPASEKGNAAPSAAKRKARSGNK